MTAASPTKESGARESWLILAPGLLALTPYLANHTLFARMYWFGDEFDLIDQMDLLGFWRWSCQVYGENFVPLFKMIWGGGILAFGGSYAAMLTLTWLAHALNVVLLGRLMRTCGLPWKAVLFAQVVFGFTSGNLESLAWAVQLSAMLSVTFLLLALDAFFRGRSRVAPIVYSAASALTFVRGILTGILVALACVLPGGVKGSLGRRTAFAAACLVPTLVIGALIVFLMPAVNAHHLKGHWGEAAAFGAWFWCLNPSDRLLRVESFGPRTVLLLGILKVVVVGYALWRSRGRERHFFILLAVFDLAYAVLLGLGRFNTGLILSTSSRYQYASLIANLPAAGFVLASFWERLPAPASVRAAVFAAVLASIAVSMCRLWAIDLEPFSVWRGSDNRRILLDPAARTVPGYPGFSMARARELVTKYNLH